MKLKVFTADGATSEDKEFANFPQLTATRASQPFVRSSSPTRPNKRQGNASTKTRSEVAGSGKKLFPPKEQRHGPSG